MDVNEYLNAIWFGNTVRTWLIAAGILLAAIAVLMASKALIVGRFFKFASRTSNELDDLVVELLKRTRLTVIVIMVVAAIGMALLVLTPGVRTAIRFIAVIALFFQEMSWGNGLISFWTQRYAARRGMTSGPSASTVGALVVLARVTLFLILFLFALDNLGFKIAPLIAGLGIGGIAVALAVQNILGDLFAALSIVIDKPFVVGDFIVIDTHAGTVEHIGLKSTRIRSLSGEQIIIGNADLLKARINNFKRMVERRVVFTFGVVYETSVEQLKRIPVIVREAIGHQQMTRFDRCHFQGYGEYDLKFETVYWVLSADYNQYMDIQQGINLELFTRFATEQIHFAQRAGTIKLGPQGSAT
jgi:small-conductance mechanosensitive channel